MPITALRQTLSHISMRRNFFELLSHAPRTPQTIATLNQIIRKTKPTLCMEEASFQNLIARMQMDLFRYDKPSGFIYSSGGLIVIKSTPSPVAKFVQVEILKVEGDYLRTWLDDQGNYNLGYLSDG